MYGWLWHRLPGPAGVRALILTVALIAAVTLTLRKRSGVRTQKPSQQVLVQRDDRLRVVKMASERPTAGPTNGDAA
jgi:NADH-quinone oxidoreductase subunit J